MDDAKIIRVALARITSDEFRAVSDEYLTRPAEDDFWRIVAVGDGEAHVSRVVADGDGVPQVYEGRRAAVANRVQRRPAPPHTYVAALAVTPADEVVGLTVNGLPVALPGPARIRGKVPGLIVRALVRGLRDAGGSGSDAGWGAAWGSLVRFLVLRGPVQLDGPDVLPLARLVAAFARASQGPG